MSDDSVHLPPPSGDAVHLGKIPLPSGDVVPLGKMAEVGQKPDHGVTRRGYLWFTGADGKRHFVKPKRPGQDFPVKQEDRVALTQQVVSGPFGGKIRQWFSQFKEQSGDHSLSKDAGKGATLVFKRVPDSTAPEDESRAQFTVSWGGTGAVDVSAADTVAAPKVETQAADTKIEQAKKHKKFKEELTSFLKDKGYSDRTIRQALESIFSQGHLQLAALFDTKKAAALEGVELEQTLGDVLREPGNEGLHAALKEILGEAGEEAPKSFKDRFTRSSKCKKEILLFILKNMKRNPRVFQGQDKDRTYIQTISRGDKTLHAALSSSKPIERDAVLERDCGIPGEADAKPTDDIKPHAANLGFVQAVRRDPKDGKVSSKGVVSRTGKTQNLKRLQEAALAAALNHAETDDPSVFKEDPRTGELVFRHKITTFQDLSKGKLKGDVEYKYLKQMREALDQFKPMRVQIKMKDGTVRTVRIEKPIITQRLFSGSLYRLRGSNWKLGEDASKSFDFAGNNRICMEYLRDNVEGVSTEKMDNLKIESDKLNKELLAQLGPPADGTGSYLFLDGPLKGCIDFEKISLARFFDKDSTLFRNNVLLKSPVFRDYQKAVAEVLVDRLGTLHVQRYEKPGDPQLRREENAVIALYSVLFGKSPPDTVSLPADWAFDPEIQPHEQLATVDLEIYDNLICQYLGFSIGKQCKVGTERTGAGTALAVAMAEFEAIKGYQFMPPQGAALKPGNEDLLLFKQIFAKAFHDLAYDMAIETRGKPGLKYQDGVRPFVYKSNPALYKYMMLQEDVPPASKADVVGLTYADLRAQGIEQYRGTNIKGPGFSEHASAVIAGQAHGKSKAEKLITDKDHKAVDSKLRVVFEKQLGIQADKLGTKPLVTRGLQPNISLEELSLLDTKVKDTDKTRLEVLEGLLQGDALKKALSIPPEKKLTDAEQRELDLVKYSISLFVNSAKRVATIRVANGLLDQVRTGASSAKPLPSLPSSSPVDMASCELSLDASDEPDAVDSDLLAGAFESARETLSTILPMSEEDRRNYVLNLEPEDIKVLLLLLKRADENEVVCERLEMDGAQAAALLDPTNPNSVASCYAEKLASELAKGTPIVEIGGKPIALQDCLAQNSGSLGVSPLELFSAIESQLKKEPKILKHESVNLTNFCKAWVQQNRDTKELDQGLQKKILDIAELVSKDAATVEQAEAIKKAIEWDHVTEAEKTSIDVVERPVDVDEIVDDISSGKIKSGILGARGWGRAVGALSDDLFRMQRMLYSKLTPSDLASAGSDEPTARMQQIDEQHEALKGYCLQKMNTSTSPVEVTQFFVEVAGACVKRGDFASAYAIFSALSETSMQPFLAKMPAYKTLEDLFDSGSANSYSALHAAYDAQVKQGNACIPPAKIFAQHIAQEHDHPLGAEWSDISAVVRIFNLQQSCLAAQGIAPKRKELEGPCQTNICLKSGKEKTAVEKEIDAIKKLVEQMKTGKKTDKDHAALLYYEARKRMIDVIEHAKDFPDDLDMQRSVEAAKKELGQQFAQIAKSADFMSLSSDNAKLLKKINAKEFDSSLLKQPKAPERIRRILGKQIAIAMYVSEKDKDKDKRDARFAANDSIEAILALPRDMLGKVLNGNSDIAVESRRQEDFEDAARFRSLFFDYLVHRSPAGGKDGAMEKIEEAFEKLQKPDLSDAARQDLLGQIKLLSDQAKESFPAASKAIDFYLAFHGAAPTVEAPKAQEKVEVLLPQSQPDSAVAIPDDVILPVSPQLQPLSAPTGAVKIELIRDMLLDEVDDAASLAEQYAALSDADKYDLFAALPKLPKDEKHDKLRKALKELAADDLFDKILTPPKFAYKLSDGQEVPGKFEDCLVYASSGLISSKELFEKMSAKLSAEGDPNKKIAILNFCHSWVTANRANVKEFSNAKDLLQNIYNGALGDADENIRIAAAKLQISVESPTPYAGIVVQDGTKECVNIFAIKKEQIDDATLDLLAKDLMAVQVELYNGVQGHELVRREKDKTTLDGVKACQDFNVKMKEYFVEQIVSQPDPVKQRRAMKSLLRLADKCLKNGDLATANTLFDVFYDPKVLKLEDKGSKIFEGLILGKDKYEEMWKNLSRVFGNPIRMNQEFLKLAREKPEKQCVPCLTGFLYQNVWFLERMDSQKSDGLAPIAHEYHPQGFSPLLKSVHECLMAQRPDHEPQHADLQTDIYKQILAPRRAIGTPAKETSAVGPKKAPEAEPQPINLQRKAKIENKIVEQFLKAPSDGSGDTPQNLALKPIAKNPKALAELADRLCTELALELFSSDPVARRNAETILENYKNAGLDLKLLFDKNPRLQGILDTYLEKLAGFDEEQDRVNENIHEILSPGSDVRNNIIVLKDTLKLLERLTEAAKDNYLSWAEPYLQAKRQKVTAHVMNQIEEISKKNPAYAVSLVKELPQELMSVAIERLSPAALKTLSDDKSLVQVALERNYIDIAFRIFQRLKSSNAEMIAQIDSLTEEQLLAKDLITGRTVLHYVCQHDLLDAVSGINQKLSQPKRIELLEAEDTDGVTARKLAQGNPRLLYELALPDNS